LGLAHAGLPVCLDPFDSLELNHAGLALPALQGLERLTHERLDLSRSVLFYAGEPPSWNLDYYGRARVGRAAHFTDRIPRSWVKPCRAMDELWVPSAFHREAFALTGISPEKLRVMRTGIDTGFFRPGFPPLDIPQRRGFNFLALTNLEDRQGTELLLTAYLQEFSAADDVSLTLKTLPHRKGPLTLSVDLPAELAWFVEKVARVSLEQAPPVILIEQSLPAAHRPALYAAADALVRPFHGAARARTLLEALACALPVIATAWGPALDFLDHENSFLVESEGLRSVPPGEDFLPGHRWAQPSLDHLRQQMRAVYTAPQQARARARRGREKLIAHWDWNALLPRWEEAFGVFLDS
jgi:glycosyltransferase involved in cell wall biosynthesis